MRASGCSHVCSNPRHNHPETEPAGYTARRESPSESVYVDVDAENDGNQVKAIPSTSDTAVVAGSAFVPDPDILR